MLWAGLPLGAKRWIPQCRNINDGIALTQPSPVGYC
jgi:hypothetical protein